MNGILNIYKTSGLSSSAVVGKVKHILHTRAVGHMGTLDPIGEGVLLMGVGKGTRLFDHFLNKTKTYEATFKFGYLTDTLDNTGVTTETTDVLPTSQEIIDALPKLVGKLQQIPPAYSAKSVNGVRAYVLARAGKAPELKPAEITVNSFKLLKQVDTDEYLFEIDCSSGTYIRSLCRDLAFSLGSLAVMTSIKRIRCGKYLVGDAVRLENLTEGSIIPLSDALSALPSYYADESLYKQIVNGVPVNCIDAPSDKFVLYCKGELLGISSRHEKGIKIDTYLKED